MRSSFNLLLVVATLVTWCSDFADAEAVVRTSSLNTKPTDSVRYLRGSKTTTTDEDALIKALNEERLSFPGLSKIKAAFQKNPTFAKSLEKFRQKRTSLNEFFAENPAIKKEIIVATVLLTLIVGVPIIVKSFYPA